MSGSSCPQRAEEQEPAGNRCWSESRQTLLDFIPFPLYCFDHFQMLSFVRRGRQVAGVELRHLAGQPGDGGD